MKKIIFLAALLSFSMTYLKADVDLRNGNFYFSSTDFVDKQNSVFKIERVYNSKSPYNGLFGNGWSSNLETFLEVSTSGELLVHEYGGGSSSYYINKSDISQYKQNIKQNINLVATAMATYGYSKLSVSALMDLYKDDRELLENNYGSLKKANKMTSEIPETGKTFYSVSEDFEYIVKSQTGYVRYTSDHEVEYYQNSGQLIQRQVNNDLISISYDERNKIIQISDGDKKSLKFNYNSRGQIEKMFFNKNIVNKYQYKSQGTCSLLFYSEDNYNNSYTYTYNDKCLITKVMHGNSEVFEITYDPHTLLPTKVIDGDDTYTYEFGPAEITSYPSHSVIKRIQSGGIAIPITEKWYSYKISKFFHPYVAKEITIGEGIKTTVQKSYVPDGEGFYHLVHKSNSSALDGSSKSTTTLDIRIKH